MYVIQKIFLLRFTVALAGGVVLLTLPQILYGYFSDDNNVIEKASFSIGEIEATLKTDSATQYLETNTSSTTLKLTTTDKSTIATQSRLTFEPQSCTADFYTALLLEVTADSGTREGNFSDIEVREVGVPSSYQLNVEVSSNFTPTEGESCSILTTLETWQTEFPDPTTGFSNEDTILITFTVPEKAEQQTTTTATTADTTTSTTTE